jgi:thiamine biosynthesis lipoprotein
MTTKAYKAVLYSLLAMVIAACSPAIEQIEMSGETMGTTYTIKVVGATIDASELGPRVNAVFEKINVQMSTWSPDSEISRFNRSRASDWFEISDEFLLVLDAARRINRQTEGAFDVTVSGLVNLWGFGAPERRSKIPQADEIAALLVHTGLGAFEIDASRKAVRKVDPEVQLDLSGIAKGYAVDLIAELLQQAGIGDFLVDIGGEIRSSGKRLDGSSWRVAIERPYGQSRSIESIEVIVPLDNAAIATSGDYRNYFEIGDKRYSHIIDPRTGNPPDNRVASVSVITGDTMTADALATGLMVMGTEKALALAARNNLAVMIIERDGTGSRVFSSAGFDALRPTQSN